MELAADSEENDEKIVALRAAQQHSRQARELHDKANSLQELLNDVNIMPAFFTSMQGEIDKLLENARQEVKKKLSNFFFNVIAVQSTNSIKKVQCMSLNLSMVAQMNIIELSIIYRSTNSHSALCDPYKKDRKSFQMNR